MKVLFRVKENSHLAALKALRAAYPDENPEGAPLLQLKVAHEACKRGWFETDADHLEAVMNKLRPFVTELRTDQAAVDAVDLGVALRRVRGVLTRVTARGVGSVAQFMESLETRFFGGK